GILREPLNCLKRADIILLNKANLIDKDAAAGIADEVLKFAVGAEIFTSEYVPVSLTETDTLRQADIKHISRKRVCAAASVGDNESFFKMLSDLGAVVALKLSFADHHKYTAADARTIVNSAKKNDCDLIVTTPKDWIRLREQFKEGVPVDPEILLLNCAIKVNNEEKFFKRIYSLFDR
ncbi:MAG: tetraacyldisaccharide 4'-kinase, partial [Candidatus Omnitrophica bacterium]|nr:tetraacyldisaccharide 4'-kinase [Candidatus Omnitrophota bacterium]